MIDLIDLSLTVLAAVGFAALLGVALRRHVRDGQPGAGALAQLLAAYSGAAVLNALALVPDLPSVWAGLALVAQAVALGVIPLLVTRFADVFDPVARGIWQLAVWATPLIVAGAALYVLDAMPEMMASAWLVVFLLLWSVGHGLAAIRLWRGGRWVAVAVARRRSQLMAAGVAGLGLLLPVAGAVDAFSREEVSFTGVLLFAVVTVALLLLGFSPPAALRWHWARRDQHQLARAERRMLEIDEPEQLATELLPHVTRLAGGSAAWLFSGRELVVSNPEGAPPRWAPGVNSRVPTDGVAVLPASVGDGHVLVARTPRGCFVAAVAPYALLFGARELDAVGALAVHLDVALDRARLKTRELLTVREVEAAQRIAEVERIRDDVLATVSHEMRTPLTTVCGMTTVLLDHWDELTDERRRALLGRVSANAADLREVVEGLLDLTALRLAAPSVPSPRSVVVLPMLERLVARMNGSLALRQVLVQAPGDTVAEFDLVGVEQILKHLVLNAAKFSPDDAPIELRAAVVGTDLRLTVADCGSGMDAEELHLAFEPFYRGGDVLRRETRGLGVGLALVVSLAESIGARIEPTSTPGQGTQITLVLPEAVCVDDSAAAAVRPSRGSTPASAPASSGGAQDRVG